MVTGEATTHYLSHPAVPARVAAMLPDVRLIAILRDPVERAYSHYQLAARNGRELLGFEQALEAEDERLAGEEQRLLERSRLPGRGLQLPVLPHPRPLPRPAASGGGRRSRRERLLVLRSEDMFADPAAVYAQATAFLGLEPDAGRHRFEARNRVSYDSMRPQTRRALRRFYAEPNRRLEQRLGRPMHWQAPE